MNAKACTVKKLISNAGCTATRDSCATSLVTSPEGVNTSTSSVWLDFLTLFSSFFRSGLVQRLFYFLWFLRISFVNPSRQPQSKPLQVNFQGVSEREPLIYTAIWFLLACRQVSMVDFPKASRRI